MVDIPIPGPGQRFTFLDSEPPEFDVPFPLAGQSAARKSLYCQAFADLPERCENRATGPSRAREGQAARLHSRCNGGKFCSPATKGMGAGSNRLGQRFRCQPLKFRHGVPPRGSHRRRSRRAVISTTRATGSPPTAKCMMSLRCWFSCRMTYRAPRSGKPSGCRWWCTWYSFS